MPARAGEIQARHVRVQRVAAQRHFRMQPHDERRAVASECVHDRVTDAQIVAVRQKALVHIRAARNTVVSTAQVDAHPDRPGRAAFAVRAHRAHGVEGFWVLVGVAVMMNRLQQHRTTAGRGAAPLLPDLLFGEEVHADALARREIEVVRRHGKERVVARREARVVSTGQQFLKTLIPHVRDRRMDVLHVERARHRVQSVDAEQLRADAVGRARIVGDGNDACGLFGRGACHRR